MTTTNTGFAPHTMRGHRVYREDVPALENGKFLKVRTMDSGHHIRVGHVVRYEPSPSRLAVDVTNHPTAELQDCPIEEVEVIVEIRLLDDHTDRWLVCRRSLFDLTLCPFGKAPMPPRRQLREVS